MVSMLSRVLVLTLLGAKLSAMLTNVDTLAKAYEDNLSVTGRIWSCACWSGACADGHGTQADRHASSSLCRPTACRQPGPPLPRVREQTVETAVPRQEDLRRKLLGVQGSL
ncbi:hypothetical protein CRUP_014135 [Coryphaenoides rupestris]|nr:hypothetical protein CRUP_014135 [Coryphaenoides rupestris]